MENCIKEEVENVYDSQKCNIWMKDFKIWNKTIAEKYRLTKKISYWNENEMILKTSLLYMKNCKEYIKKYIGIDESVNRIYAFFRTIALSDKWQRADIMNE